MYLSKNSIFYIKNHVYIATTLLIVFIILIKQNFIKNNFFIYSFFVKKGTEFFKKHKVFYRKNYIYNFTTTQFKTVIK